MRVFLAGEDDPTVFMSGTTDYMTITRLLALFSIIVMSVVEDAPIFIPNVSPVHFDLISNFYIDTVGPFKIVSDQHCVVIMNPYNESLMVGTLVIVRQEPRNFALYRKRHIRSLLFESLFDIYTFIVLLLFRQKEVPRKTESDCVGCPAERGDAIRVRRFRIVL